MTDDELMALAREAGASRYTNRHYPDRPTHTFNLGSLHRFVRLVLDREGHASVDQRKGHKSSAAYYFGFSDGHKSAMAKAPQKHEAIKTSTKTEFNDQNKVAP